MYSLFPVIITKAYNRVGVESIYILSKFSITRKCVHYVSCL